MKRILIIDDEPLIRYALSTGLRRNDYFIKPVSCGQDAIVEICHFYYDLCFLDVNLAGLSGLDIMKTIKKISPSSKIIIMTAGEVDSEMLHDIQENANLLMGKPFDLDLVKEFVGCLLGNGTSVMQGADQSCDGKDNEVFINWMIDGKRQHERRMTTHRTTYSVVSSDSGPEEKLFNASILDISNSGMGISTDYLLKPGHLLRFTDGPQVRSTGIVRWITNAGAEASYRAGIQFVTPRNAHLLSLHQA